jgi:hypothetical protein
VTLKEILHMFQKGQGHMVDPAEIDKLDIGDATVTPVETPVETGEEGTPNADG